MYSFLIGVDETELVITVPSVCRLSSAERRSHSHNTHGTVQYFITLTDVENKHSSSEFFPDTLCCVLEKASVPPEPAADHVSVAQCVGFNFHF